MATKILTVKKSDGWVLVPNFKNGANGGGSTLYIRSNSTLPTDDGGYSLSLGGQGILSDDFVTAGENVYVQCQSGVGVLAYEEV